MASYKITGCREVAGRKAGEIVSEADLTGVNIPALIKGGHLAPTTTKAAPAEPTNPEE